MLKQQSRFLKNVAISFDFIAITVAFIAAYYVRRSENLANLTDSLWVLLIILPVWYFLFTYFGIYGSLRIQPISKLAASVLKVHAIGGMVTASLFYVIHSADFSRLLFATFLFFSCILVTGEKAVVKACLSYIRRHGFNYRNILIAGTNEKALEFTRLVYSNPDLGMRIIGFLKEEEGSADRIEGKYAILGPIEKCIDVCKFYAVDEVVFCLPKQEMQPFDDYLLELEDMGITVRMVLESYISRSHRKELVYFNHQIPIMTFYCKPFDVDQLFLKRCLDIVGSIAGLFITALFFPFIALAMKLDSPGPLFFGQTRVRENGRLFTCWKFRSMYLDAEERKKELMHLNQMNGAMFKIADDPRITPVGKFLRKTSLDELPQFWNVFKGEMSLVGTRPPTPDEVTNYENWHRKRICIKPGITGMWQVNGRNQIHDFDEVVRLDLEYIEKWTLWLDMKILLKTCLVVVARRGSC